MAAISALSYSPYTIRNLENWVSKQGSWGSETNGPESGTQGRSVCKMYLTLYLGLLLNEVLGLKLARFTRSSGIRSTGRRVYIAYTRDGNNI